MGHCVNDVQMVAFMTKPFFIDSILLRDGTLITDERPRASADSFMDDPRPAELLANIEGLQRRRGQWRRLLSPVNDLFERLLLAARSIA